MARFMAWNPPCGIEKRGKQRGKRCTVSHTAETFRGPGSEGLRLSFFLESQSIPWALNVKSQMNTREQGKRIELKKIDSDMTQALVNQFTACLPPEFFPCFKYTMDGSICIGNMF